MWWAFWRRDRSRAQAPEDPPVAPTRSSRPPVEGEPDEDRRPTRAFSGASPQPGSRARELPGEVDVSDRVSLSSDGLALDMTGVRADVVALVRAAVTRDRAAAAEVLRQLDARGQDEPGMASIAAMAALGDRLVLASGFQPETMPTGATGSAEVVAQGDTVAVRADRLLRAVAPHASRDLVRLVVRFACGVPEQDPAVAHLVDAPSHDLTLVAAVLLAQTVLDGQGDERALAEELEDLLPG
ncbi:MAG: hypothetical protein JWM62_26 [Frankiales bacterium]|nr:hypothetical protein [Frankiales bacterium]